MPRRLFSWAYPKGSADLFLAAPDHLAWAVCGVAIFANSYGYWLQIAPCSPSQAKRRESTTNKSALPKVNGARLNVAFSPPISLSVTLDNFDR
jgi:hypothetical protein